MLWQIVNCAGKNAGRAESGHRTKALQAVNSKWMKRIRSSACAITTASKCYQACGKLNLSRTTQASDAGREQWLSGSEHRRT